jgi:hypothetical protein
MIYNANANANANAQAKAKANANLRSDDSFAHGSMPTRACPDDLQYL